MEESYKICAKKGSCYGLSLHRKHVYNKKLKMGRLLIIGHMIIPMIICCLLSVNNNMGISLVSAEKQRSGMAIKLEGSPLYINQDHEDVPKLSFLQKLMGLKEELGRRGPLGMSYVNSNWNSTEDPLYYLADEPGKKGSVKSNGSEYTEGGSKRVISGSKNRYAQNNPKNKLSETYNYESDSEEEEEVPTTKFSRSKLFSKNKSKNRKGSSRNGSLIFSKVPKSDSDSSSSSDTDSETESESDDSESIQYSRSSYRSRKSSPTSARGSSEPSYHFTEAGQKVFKDYKDISPPRDTFHPKKSHTFKNVVIERSSDVLDLRQKNGVLTAKFRLGTLDSHTLTLLDELSKNDAHCTVKWVSLSKSKNGGQIHLDCVFDTKAEGFSGETPITVKIDGFNKGVLHDVKLSTNGMDFKDQFLNVTSLKTEVMKAIGLDPSHECQIVSVNRKEFAADLKAFQYMTALVDSGVKNVLVIIRPSVRILIHLKRPFSGVVESYTYDGGFMLFKNYKTMLKSRKKTEAFCKKVTSDFKTNYTLVGLNNNFIDIRKYDFSWFKSYPVEMVMVLTYMPYITVNCFYHGLAAKPIQLPVYTKMKLIVTVGRNHLIKSFNDLAFDKTEEQYLIDVREKAKGITARLSNSSVLNKTLKVFSYNIVGCLKENRPLEYYIEKNQVNVITELPLSDSCTNRDSTVINLYFFNTKPQIVDIDVLVLGPNGKEIVNYDIPLAYDPRAKMSSVKQEVLNLLLKDGHLLSVDELRFVNGVNKKGENLRDDMLFEEVIDIMEQQKKGTHQKFTIVAHPRFDAFFRSRDGSLESFKLDMDMTNPTLDDFKTAMDEKLHEKHRLSPEEHVHKVKIHPVKKKKVNYKVVVRSDDKGHFPPGTKANEIAAETDLRIEIPVEFVMDNGKVKKFKIHADYGATEDEIEQLIKKELKKRGYKKKVPGLHFDIRNSKRNEFGEFWEGGPDVDNFVLNTEIANDVEVDGDIHGVPFRANIKVYPGETMDRFHNDILRTVRTNPKIRTWLEEDPSREEGIYTVISDTSGKIYEDDELLNSTLYSNSSKLRIGVSDQPCMLVWRDAMTGKEETFCLSKNKAGKCKPMPPKAAKFPIQDFINYFVEILKRQGKYKQYVEEPVKKIRTLSPIIRLKEVRTVHGHVFNCNELPSDVDFRMLEYAFNINPSEISAMVFGLMTNDEKQNLAERQKGHKKYHISIGKNTGDKESHFVDTNGLSPEELRNVIYRNFSSVNNENDIEDLKYYDDGDHEMNYEEFLKNPNRNQTFKVKFNIKNDEPRPPMPEFPQMVIQPKPTETISEYFLRAMEEPTEFGLSPMHSYYIVGEDDQGRIVHFDNMLDVPIKNLKNVKKIKFIKKPSVRPDAKPEIFYSESAPSDSPNVMKVEVDRENETTPSLNSKIRDFLIQVPPEYMGHVTIEVDNNKLNCSLETLRDAYMIKNLTVEKLFALCQNIDRQKQFKHFKMNLDVSPDELKKSETYHLLEDLGTPNAPPIANFTLYKGQTDLGLNTLVKINVGSLNSPVNEFYSKILQMFGDSVKLIDELSISLIKNGRMYPCNNSKVLKKLSDFAKTPLLKIFQICGLKATIPENGSYFHFHVSVDFNVGTKTRGTSTMGRSVPFDIMYDEDDRMSNISDDENLYPEISSYIFDNPDIDSSHMKNYRVTLKAEDPVHNLFTKTYEMSDMPHNMTLHSEFPDVNVNGINITIEDKDGRKKGGWGSETVHPANDFKNNFDALKRQIILNLKTMHGDNLDSLDSYVVKVGINGVKHQCHVESLSKLQSMTMKEFLKNCVNIEDVKSNPSMSFGVNYSPKTFDEKNFSVKVVCGDKTVYEVKGLGPTDTMPAELMSKLKEKYKDALSFVQWGAYINRMMGNCHFPGTLDSFDMRSVLSFCGVNDQTLKSYNIVFFDMNYETFKLLHGIKGTEEEEKNKDFPDVVKVTHTVKNMKSPVRISMPYSYQGPDLKVDGSETLNDFVRKIVMEEDEYNRGNPFKIKIHTYENEYGVDELPTNVINHPSRDLGGTYSFIVEDDPNGTDEGTALNIHFPDTNKTFNVFMEELQNNPSNKNKKFYFSSKDTFIPVDKVPQFLLLSPLDELKEKGYFITVINKSSNPEKTKRLPVNILSRDGVTASEFATDLQEPLTKLFQKLSKNQADLDKMLNGKFKVVIDGFEADCQVDNLTTLQNGMTLDNLLSMCGVEDLDHDHVLTIFFETPISNKKTEAFKLEVDLNDKPQESKQVDYGSEFSLSKDVENFIKGKKDAHVYLDVEGKDNLKEFVEVDTAKFLELLKGHPEVVEMLLKLGVPQTHLGSLDSLHLIISNMAKALSGHKFFVIENGEKQHYDDTKPISSYPSIVELKDKLQNNATLRLKIILTLSDGSKTEVDIRGREFIHAVTGGLTFREIALRGLSSSDSNNVVQVNFETYESEDDHMSLSSGTSTVFRKRTPKTNVVSTLGTRKPVFGKSSSSESETESPKPQSELERLRSQAKKLQSLRTKKTPSTTKESSESSSESETSESSITSSESEGESERSFKRKSQKKTESTKEEPPFPLPNQTSEQKEVKPHELGNKINGESSMDKVEIFKTILSNPSKKVTLKVVTKGGKVYNLIVRGGIIRKGIENGYLMKKLLESFLMNEDLDDVKEIVISEKIGSTFTVPLKKHVQITLPVMASDEPVECEIQDFKNPWNPPESEWKNFTLKSAIEKYSFENNISKEAKAAYFLKKEDHNNMSADILFDEEHPKKEQVMNRNIADEISKGHTLFIRYRDTGELAE